MEASNLKPRAERQCQLFLSCRSHPWLPHLCNLVPKDFCRSLVDSDRYSSLYRTSSAVSQHQHHHHLGRPCTGAPLTSRASSHHKRRVKVGRVCLCSSHLSLVASSVATLPWVISAQPHSPAGKAEHRPVCALSLVCQVTLATQVRPR